MNSLQAPFSDAINYLEPWSNPRSLLPVSYVGSVNDIVIPPARFAEAYRGRPFVPLVNPGPPKTLADNITAEAPPLQKAFQAQCNATIAAVDLAINKVQTCFAAFIAVIPEDA